MKLSITDCGCPAPGDVQSQGSGQTDLVPDLVVGNPALSKGLEPDGP